MKSIGPLSHVSLACLLAIALGCSSIRHLTPMEPGASSLSASLGGPFTQLFGVYVPLPLLSLGYNYGITKSLDVEAGLGLTQAVFGIGELNLGANYRPFLPRGWIPGLLVSPHFYFTEDIDPLSQFTVKNFRCYPDVGLTAWWNKDKWWRPFVVLENWFDLGSTRDDGLPQQDHWLIAPALGIDMQSGKWHYQIKGELYTPNLRNWGRAAHYLGPGENGVFGVFLGASRDFGGKK